MAQTIQTGHVPNLQNDNGKPGIPLKAQATFPTAFATVPTVTPSTLQDPNYPIQNLNDTFAVTVTHVSKTGFQANIIRVDAPGGWDQKLLLTYIAVATS
jgi:hypothetical protein